MARSSECTEQYAQKVLDTAGIVRDAILRVVSCVIIPGMRLLIRAILWLVQMTLD